MYCKFEIGSTNMMRVYIFTNIHHTIRVEHIVFDTSLKFGSIVEKLNTTETEKNDFMMKLAPY